MKEMQQSISSQEKEESLQHRIINECRDNEGKIFSFPQEYLNSKLLNFLTTYARAHKGAEFHCICESYDISPDEFTEELKGRAARMRDICENINGIARELDERDFDSENWYEKEQELFSEVEELYEIFYEGQEDVAKAEYKRMKESYDSFKEVTKTRLSKEQA